MGDDATSSHTSTVLWRLREWVLLNGDRLTITALTGLGVFCVQSSLTFSGLVPLEAAQPLYYVFGSLISGNLTVVTVVVAISQLLLSRELDTPGELRSQIGNVADYRREIEDAVGRITPVEPLGFFRVLIEQTRREAQALGRLTARHDRPAVAGDLPVVVARITNQAEQEQ